MYKISTCLSTAALFLSMSYTASIHAAPPPADPLSPSQNQHGVLTIKGQGSGSGGAEMSEATSGSAPSSQDLGGLSTQSLLAAATCNYWWVNGNHTWRWEGIPFIGGIRTYLDASSWTTYGTSTASCGLPLIVDRLKVEARTVGDTFPVTAQSTQYNVSTVSASNSGLSLGVFSPPCGGYSYHEAYKSGITWYAVARSGCA